VEDGVPPPRAAPPLLRRVVLNRSDLDHFPWAFILSRVGHHPDDYVPPLKIIEISSDHGTTYNEKNPKKTTPRSPLGGFVGFDSRRLEELHRFRESRLWSRLEDDFLERRHFRTPGVQLRFPSTITNQYTHKPRVDGSRDETGFAEVHAALYDPSLARLYMRLTSLSRPSTCLIILRTLLSNRKQEGNPDSSWYSRTQATSKVALPSAFQCLLIGL
jgi:hypothetical protein